MNRRVLAGVALGVAGVGIASAVGLRSAFFFPAERAEVPVRCAADAPVLDASAPITALVWNIQFSAGRTYEFFYDGGEAVSVDPADVEATLDAIAAVIREVDPDIVLLQEVDRDSRRTGRVDQHAALLERVDYPCDASTTYHRAPYVPHPPQEHLGRVDMHLSVFSRYRIDDAVRHRLPELDEPAYRKVFNLRRAVLEVALPLADGRSLTLFNTHLSAFSRGDGTLERQVERLDALASEAEATGAPWLLAGDLNCLPPGDSPTRLPEDDQPLYAGATTPIQLLFDHHWSPVPATSWESEPQRWRTYLPFGATEADRTLDYVFHADAVEATDFRVLHEHAGISDHLPLVVTFRWKP